MNLRQRLQHTRLWLTALLLACSLPVLAMNLQQAMNALPHAKAQGLVGEQPNGYLGVVNEIGRASCRERVLLSV